MEKVIQIDGRPVKFRATAAVLRLYRIKFKRDILQDLSVLQKKLEKAKDKLDVMDLTIFENVAYIMAKHADPESVPASPEEWLDGFDTFSIYIVLPELLQLWGDNMTGAVESKKNPVQLQGR